MGNQPSDLKFAFSDFLQLLKKHKKTVIFFVLLGALSLFLLASTRKTTYLVQATFRDKGKAQANIHSSLTDLLFSQNAAGDSEASATMHSHKLLSEVVKKLNVQGFINPNIERYPELENIQDNLFAEWAYLAEYQVPILPDLKPALEVHRVKYDGEITIAYKIEFQDDDTFILFDKFGKEYATVKVGKEASIDDVKFTVQKTNKSPVDTKGSYIVIIQPLRDVTKNFNNLLVVDVDREDKTLLKLQFRHRDRHFAVKFLNTLMEAYQNYLEEDHEKSAKVQLSYLEKRQKQVSEELKELMEAHVENISQDMSETGFTSLQKELEFLAQHLAQNQQKLTELKLETKRLSSVDPECCVFYDAQSTRGDPAVINQLLAELRVLKAQSDNLNLALQSGTPIPQEISKEAIEETLANLEGTKLAFNEIEDLKGYLKGEKKQFPSVKALNDPHYPISAWIAAFKSKERALQFSSSTKKALVEEELNQFKNHFLAYIDGFKQLLTVKQGTLSQKLKNSQKSDPEFEGLNLESSRQQHMNYLRELSGLQAEEKQHTFVLEQLDNPTFEISSLTALLRDPVSLDRIGKATQLTIALKDTANRTQKEIDRLQEEYDLQKSFLASHVEQIRDLLSLKIELFQEKIKMLQGLILDQTYQQMSLLKKNLSDYISNRLQNLKQEENLLQDHQKELHARMKKIPPKWAGEQVLNQNLAMQQRFLENLTVMVESKNITKNLERVQSYTLDDAAAPLNPKPPRLTFFTIFGSILGFIGASTLLFSRALVKGILASPENLRLAKLHVSGPITKYQGSESTATPPYIDTDLDSLRRLIAHVEKCSTADPKMVLIVQGGGIDFTNTLAKLLSKKGQRTLKISLDFTKPHQQTTVNGLLAYLENKIEAPTIEKYDGFDAILAGGNSRYSEELLRSKRFIELLDKLKPHYDWILAVSPAKIPSAEAENLAKFFTTTAITVSDETIQDIIAFTKHLDADKQPGLTFLFAK